MIQVNIWLPDQLVCERVPALFILLENPVSTLPLQTSVWHTINLLTVHSIIIFSLSHSSIWYNTHPTGFGRVVFAVLIPVSLDDFGPRQQQSYIESIAETSQTPATKIAILNRTEDFMTQASLDGTRRTADSMKDMYLLQIQTQILFIYTHTYAKNKRETNSHQHILIITRSLTHTPRFLSRARSRTLALAFMFVCVCINIHTHVCINMCVH